MGLKISQKRLSEQQTPLFVAGYCDPKVFPREVRNRRPRAHKYRSFELPTSMWEGHPNRFVPSKWLRDLKPWKNFEVSTVFFNCYSRNFGLPFHHDMVPENQINGVIAVTKGRLSFIKDENRPWRATEHPADTPPDLVFDMEAGDAVFWGHAADQQWAHGGLMGNKTSFVLRGKRKIPNG